MAERGGTSHTPYSFRFDLADGRIMGVPIEQVDQVTVTRLEKLTRAEHLFAERQSPQAARRRRQAHHGFVDLLGHLLLGGAAEAEGEEDGQDQGGGRSHDAVPLQHSV